MASSSPEPEISPSIWWQPCRAAYSGVYVATNGENQHRTETELNISREIAMAAVDHAEISSNSSLIVKPC